MVTHFSHHVCTGILIPVLPLIREGFGLTYFQSGILVSSFSLAYGFGQVPMAVLADRLSRRLIIVVGLIGTALASIGVSITDVFWQMVPFFVVLGLLGGTYHAPASSFISQVMPSDKRGRALGTHITGGSASFFLTPALALGIASLLHSWRASFLLLPLPAILVAVLLWITTEEPRGDLGEKPKKPGNGSENPEEVGPGQLPSETQVSWGQIVRSIGIIACLGMAMQIVFASVNSYLPLYIVDQHHVSPKLAGIVISIIAGAGIFGAPLGGALSDRFGRKELILLSLCLVGPFFFAVTKSPFGIPLIISLLLYGLAMSVRMPTMESLIADVVPVGRRTTALGIYFFMGMETAGLTTPVVGYLIDLYGLDPVFTGLAAGLCVVGAFALLIRKKL